MRLLISTILNIKIKDTQCGYKLYKKRIGKLIFSKLKTFDFNHDLVIILLLKAKNIKIKEYRKSILSIIGSFFEWFWTCGQKIFFRLFSFSTTPVGRRATAGVVRHSFRKRRAPLQALRRGASPWNRRAWSRAELCAALSERVSGWRRTTRGRHRHRGMLIDFTEGSFYLPGWDRPGWDTQKIKETQIIQKNIFLNFSKKCVFL